MINIKDYEEMIKFCKNLRNQEIAVFRLNKDYNEHIKNDVEVFYNNSNFDYWKNYSGNFKLLLTSNKSILKPKPITIDMLNAAKDQIRGELAKEEAKVLTEDYKYGERKGSIQWADEEFKSGKQIFHRDSNGHEEQYKIVDGYFAKCENEERLISERYYFNNWYSKSDKEQLFESIDYEIEGSDRFYEDRLRAVLKNYEVKRK